MLKFVQRATKTDNKSIANKIFLRNKATKHLKILSVLDLFAGNNLLWKTIDKERYYGVELIPDKGVNLNANANQVISSLDLSDFNVIDCDSYGIPFEICEKIIMNKNIESNTVVIYTAITNAFTALPKVCINNIGIKNLYKIAPSLFNTEAITYFYDMLANLGINEVNYYEVIDGYTKHYGYFIIP